MSNDEAVEVRKVAQEVYGSDSAHEDFAVIDGEDPEKIVEDDGKVSGYWVKARVWVPADWVKK